MKDAINNNIAADTQRRAKRADLDAANERFKGILRVCENRDDDGCLNTFKVGIIKAIAQGQSLEQVAMEEGWRSLGLEVVADVEVVDND